MVSAHLPQSRLGRAALASLLLLVLTALGRAGVERFEAQASEKIRASLDDRGMTWVKLEVDGRRVQLGGARPMLGAGGEAVAAARDAECMLLAIEIRCASSVAADFGEMEPQREIDTDL